MRLVPDSMTDAWLSEDKTGPRRPVVRATISHFRLKKFPYDLKWAPGGSDMDWESRWQRHGVFTSGLFGGDMGVREIRNIKSYTWSRSVDQDVATCRLVLLNTELTPIGNADRVESTTAFDMPGFYTYNRGAAASIERWGFEETGWEDIFVPDRLVKTYEGYGIDSSMPPGLDPNLMPSGTWLIDTVTYNSADGQIELDMRDIGKLLVDQIVFPPVIPYAEYPLAFEALHTEQVQGREPTGGTWSGTILDEGNARSSNSLYTVEADDDPDTGSPYVEADEEVQGHKPRDAVRELPDDADPDKPTPYWLSTGQENRWDKVWWEFDFDDPRSVAALRVKLVGGPYRVYVSLKDSSGEWKGRRKIRYEPTTKDVNLHADMPFVRAVIGERGKVFDIVLKRVYHDITKVRLTFTRLWSTETSVDYPWRAGLRHIQIYRNTTGDADGSDLDIEKGTHNEVVGNYHDYTDIIKMICCWGGFYWPGHGQESGGGQVAEDYVRLGWVGPTGGEVNLKRSVRWADYDPRLPRGRCWGDFMATGTHGIADLTVDLFDKQPLMDVISYIRDMIGFVFFVDELGGAIWRMPNNVKPGNYLSPIALGAHTRTRTKQYVTIDEDETLLDFQVAVSAEGNREVIFVANLTGDKGVAIEGYAPSNANMRRTAGWTDSKFASQKECRVMADMIATQQMFAYRTARATIPGNPAIQIDDQVRFFERVTNDTYFHYVKGVDCSLDMDSGEYTYTLTTHWLGEDEDNWQLDTHKLASVTQQYMNHLAIEDHDNHVEAEIIDEGIGGP